MTKHDGYMLMISCHGDLKTKLPSHPFFLCGSDYKEKEPEKDGLRINVLLEHVQSLPAYHKVVVVNCCYSSSAIGKIENLCIKHDNDPDPRVHNMIINLTCAIEPLITKAHQKSFEIITSTGAKTVGFVDMDRDEDIFCSHFSDALHEDLHKHGSVTMRALTTSADRKLEIDTGTRENKFPFTTSVGYENLGEGALLLIAKKRIKLVLPRYDNETTMYTFLDDPPVSAKANPNATTKFGLGDLPQRIANNWCEEAFGDLRVIALALRQHGPFLMKAMYAAAPPPSKTGFCSLLQLLVRRTQGALHYLVNANNRAKCENLELKCFSVASFLSILSETFLGLWLLKEESFYDARSLAKKLPTQKTFTDKFEKNVDVFRTFALPTRRLEDNQIFAIPFMTLEANYAWTRLAKPVGLGTGLRLLHLLERHTLKIKDFSGFTECPSGFLDELELYQRDYDRASESLKAVLTTVCNKLPPTTKYAIAEKLKTISEHMESLKNLIPEMEKGAKAPENVSVPPVPAQQSSSPIPSEPSMVPLASNANLPPTANGKDMAPAKPIPTARKAAAQKPSTTDLPLCFVDIPALPSSPYRPPVPSPEKVGATVAPTAARNRDTQPAAPASPPKKARKGNAKVQKKAARSRDLPPPSAATNEDKKVNPASGDMTSSGATTAKGKGGRKAKEAAGPSTSTQPPIPTAAVNESLGAETAVEKKPKSGRNLRTKGAIPFELQGVFSHYEDSTIPLTTTSTSGPSDDATAALFHNECATGADAAESSSAAAVTAKNNGKGKGKGEASKSIPSVHANDKKATVEEKNEHAPQTTQSGDGSSDKPNDGKKEGSATDPAKGVSKKPKPEIQLKPARPLPRRRARNGSEQPSAEEEQPSVEEEEPSEGEKKKKSEEPPNRITTREIKQEEQKCRTFDNIFGEFVDEAMSVEIKNNPEYVRRCIQHAEKWENWVKRRTHKREFPPKLDKPDRTFSDEELLLHLEQQFYLNWEKMLVYTMHLGQTGTDNKLQQLLVTWIALGFILYRIAWARCPNEPVDTVAMHLSTEEFKHDKALHQQVKCVSYHKLRKMHMTLNGFREGTTFGDHLYVKPEVKAEKEVQLSYLRELQVPNVQKEIIEFGIVKKNTGAIDNN